MNDYKVPVYFMSNENFSAMTKWIGENKTGNWGWFPGKPGHFHFVNEEDKIKFILRWA